MIALPVAALGFAAVARDTFTLTPAEQADRLMGGAQALVVWGSANPVHQDPTNPDLLYSEVQLTGQGGGGAAPGTARLLALLPPGTKALDDRSGPLSVRTVAGTASLRARMLDYTDPLARGILRQRAGRAPAGVDEVALTPAASRRTGAGVGGTVRTTDGRTLRVVGIVEDPTDLEGTTIVLHDPQPPGALPVDRGALPVDRGDVHWLVATPGPLTWDQVKRLNTRGVVAISRSVLEHPPSQAERYPEHQSGRGAFQATTSRFLGGVGLLEIVLLAGPAFAVGARRRRRDLALLAAAGGTPAHLRRIVLADGVVLGALAAAGGVALGILAAAAGRPLLEEHVAHFRSGGFRFFPEALAALAALDRSRVRLTVGSVSFKNGKDERQRTVTASGFALPHPPRAPVLMMTSATARSLGIDSVPSMALATTSRMPTVAEEDRLHAALGTRTGAYVERGSRASSDTTTLLVLAAVAGLVTLGAAAIATGLAAAGGRADLATLGAVGASPRVRRGLSLSQSGVIAGLGSLLGGAAGLGAAVAVLFALNRGSADVWPAPTPYPVAIPWLNVAVALLVVPVVAMLGAGLLTRSRLPIERRL
jgi:hypothetical protein